MYYSLLFIVDAPAHPFNFIPQYVSFVLLLELKKKLQNLHMSVFFTVFPACIFVPNS